MPIGRKLTEAAKAGRPEAQYQLAAILATGDNCEKDIVAAAAWYKKAADQGHSEAMYNLGLMQLLGELGGNQKKKGLALIERAAEAGSWDAQWLLADVFSRGGQGVKRDPERAAYYSALSLNCKSGPAALAVGLRLRDRGLRAVSFGNALIRVAAKMGSKEANKLPSKSKPKPRTRG